MQIFDGDPTKRWQHLLQEMEILEKGDSGHHQQQTMQIVGVDF